MNMKYIKKFNTDKINEMIKIEGNFKTVEELYNVLGNLINEQKGDYKINVDFDDYRYDAIEEIKVYDDTKIVIIV